jgi:uncharacterized membrane protein YgcG
MLNIFEIREDFWSIKRQDCGNVDNYASWIDWKIMDYNLCTGPTATSTAGTDAANTDNEANAMMMAKMSEQQHMFSLLRGIPRNDKWIVFLALMMDKNAMITATPDEIVTKLVKKEAAINRENGLAPDALLFAKNSGKGSNGGNGDKAGRGGKSSRRDSRDNKGDNKRKEKGIWKCFHSQR